jgi:hypothetical protein
MSISTCKITKSLLYVQKYCIKKNFFTEDYIKMNENVIFY